MEILTPGHVYKLSNFDDNSTFQTITFIKKQPKDGDKGELELVFDGTTNEELLEVLIDRLNFLRKALDSEETKKAIEKCKEALFWLNHRTSNRLKRNVEGTHLP